MTDKTKLENLKNMILSIRKNKQQQKDLSESIRVNKEVIEETILDAGDIEACRELVKKNYRLESEKKEFSAKVKKLNEGIEALILGEGEYDGQTTIDDFTAGE